MSRQKENSTLIHFSTPAVFPNAYAASNFNRNVNRFHSMEHEEPHLTRRKMILDKHPEIKTIMVLDPSSFWITIALVGIQTYICSLVQDLSFWQLAFLSYALGGVLSNGLFVMIHDLTHFTAFKSRKANQYTAILANFGNGIPTAMAFGKFHSDHHSFLGRTDKDADIPCSIELKFFNNRCRKILHVISMLIWYVVRPYCQGNKTPSFLEIFNIVVVIAWDIFLLYLFGWKAIFYLAIGSLSGLGPNPVAFRYMAEHFEFVSGQDTYSYYGPFNYIMFNVGYHVEHHDFPNIPWRYLPKIKNMAPEFYEPLPAHSSYFLCLWKYVMDPSFGPWCRISRPILEEDRKKKRNIHFNASLKNIKSKKSKYL
jgi:sphingolipid delta-4 desaturase